MFLVGTSPIVRLGITVCLTIIGIWAIQKSLSLFDGDDPQKIVIDEVCGLGLALSFCSTSWLHLAIGFILFRLFDIVKPWPVSWADRKIKGALGIMLDDLLAGLYAAVLLWFLP